MKENKNFVKEAIPYIVIIIVVILIRTFIITPVKVDGDSMLPTLKDKEFLLLKKYDKSFNRFDVIVFENGGDRIIKRVIGLPGEKVEYKENKLYIHGKYIKENFKRNSKTADFKLADIKLKKVPKNSYFVMGDNRNNSSDSRFFGPVPKEKIKGSTNLSIYPFKRAGKINKE